jgi:hypothetical protein
MGKKSLKHFFFLPEFNEKIYESFSAWFTGMRKFCGNKRKFKIVEKFLYKYDTDGICTCLFYKTELKY